MKKYKLTETNSLGELDCVKVSIGEREKDGVLYPDVILWLYDRPFVIKPASFYSKKTNIFYKRLLYKIYKVSETVGKYEKE